MVSCIVFTIIHYAICDCESRGFLKGRVTKWHGGLMDILTLVQLELRFKFYLQPGRFWVGENALSLLSE